jgi:hypothetical protein
MLPGGTPASLCVRRELHRECVPLRAGRSARDAMLLLACLAGGRLPGPKKRTDPRQRRSGRMAACSCSLTSQSYRAYAFILLTRLRGAGLDGEQSGYYVATSTTKIEPSWPLIQYHIRHAGTSYLVGASSGRGCAASTRLASASYLAAI